jgi:hypothetical protein
MATFPKDRSFVKAAIDAVIAAGLVPLQMDYFAARDKQPEDACISFIAEAEIYLGVIGFRYGSIVPGGSGTSYTELEFIEASRAKKHRLIFLLDDDALVPRRLVDPDASKVDRFRQRLLEAGLILRRFKSADSLESEIFRALNELRTERNVPSVLTASVGRRRPPTALLPPLPSRYVPRAELLEEARGMLLAPLSRRSAIVGLIGMGGAGKSTLARALAHDEKIQQEFPDGVAWVDVGTNPDLTACLEKIAALFGDVQPIVDITVGRERISRLIEDARCILVLDNVWDIEHLRTLDFATSTVRLLVTSRSRDCLYLDASISTVGSVDNNQARQLLARYSGTDLDAIPPEAEEIISYCGGLVLALAIAGGLVAEGRRWSNVAQRIRRASLAKLTARFSDYPHPDLLKALDASVTALPESHRARYRELGVFEGRGPIPVSVVRHLWRRSGSLDELDSEDLILSLSRRSLIQWEPYADTFTLHDLLFNYVCSSHDHQEIRATHKQFAEALLDHWGGLDENLPDLRSRTMPSAEDQYAVQHISYHLASAGSDGFLHRLLATEWPVDHDQAVNAWFATHDRAGWSASYIPDLTIAWQLAEQSTDRDLEQKRPARALGLEIRYALMRSSIASLAASIPPSLITRLVQTGRWDVPQALTYVDSIPDPRSRTLARVGLAPYLPDHLLSSVLGTARRIEDLYLRVWAIASMVRNLPIRDRARLVRPEFEVARAILDPAERVRAVVSVVQHFPVKERIRLVEPELEVARAILDPAERVRAVVSVVQHFPVKERIRLVEPELEVARAILDPAERVRAVVSVVQHFPVKERIRLVEPELEVARAILDPAGRAKALVSIVTFFPQGVRSCVLGTELDAATQILSSYLRAQVILNVAPYLEDNLIASAFAVLATLSDPCDYARALAAMAPFLPLDRRSMMLREALERTVGIQNPFYRAQALASLIPVLPSGLLSLALDIVSTIDRPSNRADLLGSISLRLPRHQLGRALEIARTIERTPDGAQALADLTPHLPVAERIQLISPILGAIRTLDDVRDRVQALAFLIPHIPLELIGEAIEIARTTTITIGDPKQEIRRGLSVSVRLRLFGPALDAARAIDNSYYRAQALAALAPQLPAELQPVALTVANEISEPYGRAWALAGLAPHLPETRKRELLNAALQSALVIDDQFYRAQALAGLAPHIAEESLRELVASAINAVVEIDNLSARGLAQCALIRNLPRRASGRILRQAVETAERIEDDRDRAELLTFLAPYLTPALLRRALKVARWIDNPSYNVIAIGGLAPQLKGKRRWQLLSNAVEYARAVENLSSQVVTERDSADYLKDARYEDWWRQVYRDALRSAARRNRRSTLDLIPELCATATSLAGNRIVEDSLEAARLVQYWWP